MTQLRNIVKRYEHSGMLWNSMERYEILETISEQYGAFGTSWNAKEHYTAV